MLNYTQKSLPMTTIYTTPGKPRALTWWYTDWQLTKYAQKCFILHLGTQITSSYTFKNSLVYAPASVTDLGITNDNLKFKTHSNNIAHRAHYCAYAINKCFVSRNRCTLLCACTTYVRPLLEYASLQSSGLIKSYWIGSTAFCSQFTRLQSSDLERLKLLHIDSLEKRRPCLYIQIIFGLVNWFLSY